MDMLLANYPQHTQNRANEENILPTALFLTPLAAVTIFVASCLAGYQFRRVWKAEGPLRLLWLWGVLAAVGLLTLGFVPVRVAG